VGRRARAGRLHAPLARLRVTSWDAARTPKPEVQAKIADETWPTLENRVEPLHLTVTRNELLQEDRDSG